MPRAAAQAAGPDTPLSIGTTFTIESRVLGEQRRINVYAPSAYSSAPAVRLPVLYMPDGGIGEDFLHVAGLVQVLTGNGTMRPFLLVGIENTARRRDMTGPTTNAADRKIAPVVGGSAMFRRFIREELIPAIDARYRTTRERAIVGESLAGLFVVETLLREPELFDSYLAFDPSLWWNSGALVDSAGRMLRDAGNKALYVANSNEPGLAVLVRRLADTIAARPASGFTFHHEPMPQETHATIYHPAALHAFRFLLAPR